jgi:hypothetical protein
MTTFQMFYLKFLKYLVFIIKDSNIYTNIIILNILTYKNKKFYGKVVYTYISMKDAVKCTKAVA